MQEPDLENWFKNAFKFPEYELTLKDKKQIKFFGIAQWIYERLLKGEFRRSTVKEETRADILKKVKLSVEKKEPIYLIVCFGGYKHFWNQSYPEIDFAELFNLRFMARYVSPILKAYEPGVILDYESEDVIIPWMDNYPPADIDRYAASFKDLIGEYSKNIPANFKINYVRSQTQLDENKLIARIKEMLPEAKKKWEGLSKEELQNRIHRSPKNIMWKGAEDWSHLSESEREKKIIESKIVNETYYAADFEFREKYFTHDTHIPLVLSFGITSDNAGSWLMLGSTKSSFVDFWAGRGVLDRHKGKIIERVLSQVQYGRIREKLKIFDAFKESQLKNFKTIELGEDLEVYAPKTEASAKEQT